MSHKFNQLIIGFSGVCEGCKRYIGSKKTLTMALDTIDTFDEDFTDSEIDQFILNPKTLREFKLELALNELIDETDIHVCKPLCSE